MKKHKILFVDDDPYLLKGLDRSLEEYSDFWDADFAPSGEFALKKLAGTQFDAVISDLLMPQMDGITLLEIVANRYPEVLRFVLSGNTNDFQAVRSSAFLHQLFPKPCEMEQIFQGVERACRLKDSMSDPNLIRAITSIKTLPSKPALYERLMGELQAPEPSLKSIGEIVSQDTAMTAKILQLVNSAFFGLAGTVSNPQRAVTILGTNALKALVLCSHVFTEYERRANIPPYINNLWNHSVLVSNLARKIAADIQLSSQEQEDAQVSGILHDIGKFLEYEIPEFARQSRSWKGYSTTQNEYTLIGTSHGEMGAYLLGIWGLPSHIVETVMYHNVPSHSLAAHRTNALTSLHLANGLVNMCNFEASGNFEPYLDLNYLQGLVEFERLNHWLDFVRNMAETEA